MERSKRVKQPPMRYVPADIRSTGKRKRNKRSNAKTTKKKRKTKLKAATAGSNKNKSSTVQPRRVDDGGSSSAALVRLRERPPEVLVSYDQASLDACARAASHRMLAKSATAAAYWTGYDTTIDNELAMTMGNRLDPRTRANLEAAMDAPDSMIELPKDAGAMEQEAVLRVNSYLDAMRAARQKLWDNHLDDNPTGQLQVAIYSKTSALRNLRTGDNIAECATQNPMALIALHTLTSQVVQRDARGTRPSNAPSLPVGRILPGQQPI
jgi:hypothetical protein